MTVSAADSSSRNRAREESAALLGSTATYGSNHVPVGSTTSSKFPSGHFHCSILGSELEHQQLSRKFSSTCIDDEGDGGQGDGTYWGLLRSNGPFRLYLSSMLVTLSGEWFTYIASITMIQRLRPDSFTAISIYATVRLIPALLFTSFGGVLADSRDRRQSMIILDCAGAVVGLMYVLALKAESLVLLYSVAFVQQSIAALYEPVRCAIVPQMVQGDENIKKALTLTGVAWSVMAALGTSLGGLIVASFGLYVCFLLDSVTYLSSALLMWLVGGEWNVKARQISESFSIPALLTNMHSMTVDGLHYLAGSFFGPLILLKASGELIVGASDVVNVALSEVQDNEQASTVRFGVIFGWVGIGCFIGPVIADPLTDMNRPRTLQISCVISMILMAISFLGMTMDIPFTVVCLFSAFWAAGLNAMWTGSSLLLQKYSKPEQFGRVVALDTLLYNLSRALSAFLAGLLHDHMGLDVQNICLVFSVLMFCASYGWLVYHKKGGGAASEESDRFCTEDEGLAPPSRRKGIVNASVDLRGMSWVSLARENMRQLSIDAGRYFSWTEINLCQELLPDSCIIEGDENENY